MIIPCTWEDLKLFGKMVEYSPTVDATGIKLVINNEIHAMVAYDHWTPNAVQLHICVADKKTFSRRFLREAFSYPFLQAGRTLCLAVIPSDNTASLSLAQRAGFVEKYRVVDGWEKGVDMVVHELRRGDCIWLPTRVTIRPLELSGPPVVH